MMPSTAEIQQEFGYSSPGTVTTHLEGLRKKGVIEWNGGKHRGIRFTSAWQSRKTRDVPFLGEIPAGFPDDAELQTGSSIAFDVEELGLSPTAAYFVIEVRGDSMVDAGIVEGDVILLEHEAEPRSGEIVAAFVDGRVTLKRFVIDSGEAILRAENVRYPDILPAHQLTIQGVFRALIRTSGR